jgi:uncharacterized protein (UPF0335 family)
LSIISFSDIREAKKEFIELLERDEEFRYTVAGFLGLSEILKRLEKLEEGQNKLWEEVKKIWEEVRLIRIDYNRMRKYIRVGFGDLGRALRVTFEDHSASFLEVLLEEPEYTDARIERKVLVHDGEAVEINMFCEDPLVVGEATISIESMEEAEKEVEKLLKRVEIVEKRYGKRPMLVVLSVARPAPGVSRRLEDLAKRHGIKLVLGEEIEEAIAI